MQPNEVSQACSQTSTTQMLRFQLMIGEVRLVMVLTEVLSGDTYSRQNSL